MNKPDFYFYTYPYGGGKFAIFPYRNGKVRVEMDHKSLGIFPSAETGAHAASAALLASYPSMKSVAEKITDLDWWERSPSQGETDEQ